MKFWPERPNGDLRLYAPPATMPSRKRLWVSACLTILPWAPAISKKTTASKKLCLSISTSITATAPIIDIDVHHGNGTQAAFYDSADVLFVSLHQFPGFPGSGNFGEVGRGPGEGFTVNVPLAKGCGDRDIARIIYYLINPLALAYGPEIILVSCGFDLYLRDRLGGMRVTPEGYALFTFFLLNIAERVCNGRILFVLEGGYSIQGIQECGLRVMRELCNIPTLTPNSIERVADANPARLSYLKKVFEIQKKYWNNLA